MIVFEISILVMSAILTKNGNFKSKIAHSKLKNEQFKLKNDILNQKWSFSIKNGPYIQS